MAGISLEVGVHKQQDLSAGLVDDLTAWFDSAFGYLKWTWSQPDAYVLAYAGGKLIGRLGLTRRIIEVGDRSVNVIGVGGVVVREDVRHRGVGTALMDCAHDYIDQSTDFFGLLYCGRDLVAYYQARGWKNIVTQTWLEQPGGRIVHPRHMMVYGVSRRSWPDGDVDLRGLPW